MQLVWSRWVCGQGQPFADCGPVEADYPRHMCDNVRVRARIRLLSSEGGGRSGPVHGSYRPKHNFGGPDNREMDVGFIQFGENVSLRPGEAMDLEITFLARPGLSDVLVRGREWRIQEGLQLVGVGTILEILERST